MCVKPVVIPSAAIFSAVKWGLSDISWGWVVGAFYLMTIGVTLGFHRYFSHHSFKTWFLCAMTSGFPKQCQMSA